MQTVSAEYLMGIKEGREMLEKFGTGVAHDELDNLRRTIKGFPSYSPVGQMLRGERDFWLNQLKRA
ncbi:hypothetical protein B7760_01767 [Burkholderia glumae]|uniref:hypothetical protein n=1 Tax=Burkholderia glumae TaxID=337 RepID=UPI00157A4CB0|nr:hypothetical protein [Burkholderia glumae]QKM47743.1 hypothetical protein B7760_01767 [Burkholderia glumae]